MREDTLKLKSGDTAEAAGEKIFSLTVFLRLFSSPVKLATSLLIAALLGIIIMAIGSGAVEISPMQALAIITNKFGINMPIAYEAQQEAVLLAIRLPRVILGLTVGAGLAVSGVVLQSLFRNPLADPTLIGVSSGAALAVSLTIVLGETAVFSFLAIERIYFLPFAAFAGGIGATLLIYRLGKRSSETNVATMLLAGIAVNAFAMAGIGLMSFLATDAQLRNISFWNLGSLAGATWQALAVTVPLIVIAVFLLLRLARSFDVILLGEAEARHLGIDTQRLKWQAIALVALIVGAAVAVTGIISFVGLVVPHLLRLLTGANHRALLRNSVLLGANLLLAADILARTIVAPAELPIGVVTALIGAPFFVWLLVRKQN